METGELVYQAFQKNVTKATWPSIRFSSDEAVACRLTTNEVQFFDAGDFSKGIVNRLRVQGIAAFELSKSPGSYVAAFVPESKKSVVPRLKSWIRKVALEEDDEGLMKKNNAKSSAAEEATAAAKAAAVAAADVARAGDADNKKRR